MNVITSFALLTLLVIVTISIVFMVAIPMVNTMTITTEIQDAEKTIKGLDDVIKEVVGGGQGAARVYRYTNSPEMRTFSEDNSIQYSRDIEANIFEYLSRKAVENTIYITGSNVNCYEQDADNNGTTDLILENNYIKMAFQHVPKSDPLPNIDTKGNIILITEKTYGTTIYVSNSSVVIDDNMTTSFGTGYSEIQRKGMGLPVCQIHFFVDSQEGTRYDIFYRLYAGADFVVMDVRNVV